MWSQTCHDLAVRCFCHVVWRLKRYFVYHGSHWSYAYKSITTQRSLINSISRKGSRKMRTPQRHSLLSEAEVSMLYMKRLVFSAIDTAAKGSMYIIPWLVNHSKLKPSEVWNIRLSLYVGNRAVCQTDSRKNSWNDKTLVVYVNVVQCFLNKENLFLTKLRYER